MDSATHMSLGLCLLLGFALLLGLMVWFTVRSPKAGAIGWGVLALCVLAGLALFTARVQVSPAGSSVVYATPWWGVRARLILLPAIAAVFLGVIGLIVWGFARNPKKGFAIVGGLFLTLLLIAVLAIPAAIFLPAWARTRYQSSQSTMSGTPMTAELSPAVREATTRPVADAITTDPWVTAVASSEKVSAYGCRELACAALTREALAALRKQGRIGGDAGSPFTLTLDVREPATLETWKRAEPAIRAALRAEFGDRADRVIAVAWADRAGDAARSPQALLNGGVLRWFEESAGGDAKDVTADLITPLQPDKLKLIRDGQLPLQDITKYIGMIPLIAHEVYEKGWVLGTERPAGRPGPFIVGRSQPAASTMEARRRAGEDAARQLADKIREQLKRVIGADPVASGPDALLQQAEKLIVDGATLVGEAGERGPDASRTTAAVRGPEKAARSLVHAFSSATSSLRRESNELARRASRATTGEHGRDAGALIESRSLSQSAQALVRQAEALEARMQHVSAKPGDSTLADQIQAEAFAESAKMLRQEAARIREQASRATAVRSDRGTANVYSDPRLAAADVVAARALANTGSSVRLDDYTQMVLSSASGARWMTAILLDASPATIDTLVSEALTTSASSGSGRNEISRQLIAVAALLVIIILAYAFIAAGRYGAFKWPVRVVASVAFVTVCAAVGHLFASAQPLTIPELPGFVSVQTRSPALVDRLRTLARTSPAGVETAVTIAAATDTADARLGCLDLLVCGEYLLLGGHAEEAVKAIEVGIRRGGTENWYQKSLGLALLSAGRNAEAKRAFAKAAGSTDSWKNRRVTNGSLDAWTAAYFLDLVSEADYTKAWKNTSSGESMACFPWFYVGQRMEIEGKRDAAIAAYGKSVELGRQPGAHYSSNWSAYRLGVLAGTIRPPSSEPSTRASAADATD